MPELRTHTCERCGRPKGVANHWLIAQRKRGSFLVCTWEAGQNLTGGKEYYCGHDCLLGALADYLYHATFPGRKPGEAWRSPADGGTGDVYIPWNKGA